MHGIIELHINLMECILYCRIFHFCMDVSIGIMAYNEEKNIGALIEALHNQKTRSVRIKEIIVVSSGSTDKTDEIVKHSSVRLIRQEKRLGKASAINEFLKTAVSDILVLCSADINPNPDTVEKLCRPLQKPKIGIVASRPVPKTKKNLIGKIVKRQWQLHHKISLKKPKFGEMIAFRKVFTKIENTAADEEYIAMLVMRNGYHGVYAPDAVVHNKGPNNISDFIRQKRRIHCGHLELWKKYRYRASSSVSGKAALIVKELQNQPLLFCCLIFFEGLSRILGSIDYYQGKRHYIWQMIESSK